jgi:guanylate kinase
MSKPSTIQRRGLMLVLSSPSGAGKTSIARGLLASDSNIRLSVSVTTRAPREGERDGIDYHFIDEAHYRRMVEGGELLEHALVFDHHYGTPRQEVEDALSQGRDVLFDIDWQGTQQLREGPLSRDLVSVFILPPSVAALHERLRTRAQDSEEVIANRMARAGNEMSHWAEYDYVVVNHDLAASIEQVRAVLTAERQRRVRLQGLSDYVRGLQAEL